MLLRPERSVRIGSAIFGIAMVAFGLICVLPVGPLPQLEPLPAWLPAHLAAALFTAPVLLVAGAHLALDKRTAAASMVLGALFATWLAALHLPLVIAKPRNGGEWVLFFEVLAIGAVPWLLAGVLESGAAATASRRANWRRVAFGARFAFGISLVAFGCSHFVYLNYVSSNIPAWIPAHRFFAYFTGVAHIAGGVSIITRVQARLAGVLLALMFGSWVWMIWVPLVMASPADRATWMNSFIAVAMCGGSLLVGALVAKDDAKALSAAAA